MHKVSFKVPKNLGAKYAALLRSAIIENTPVVKPFAFSLGDHSTPYRPSENIKDLTILGDRLVSYSYNFSSEVSFPLVLTYNFKGVFKASDLNKSILTVVCDNPDEVLLESFSPEKDNTLILVFFEGTGIHHGDENKHMLNGLVADPSEFRVLTVRMSDVKISTDIKSLLDSERVTLTITSANGKDEERLQNAIKQIVDVFSSIS